MRIFLDARMLHVSGIGIYIQNLLQESLGAVPEHSFLLAGDPEEIEQFTVDHNDLAGINRVEAVKFKRPIYGPGEQIYGSLLAGKYGPDCDILHFPHFNAPWFLPPSSVVTVHDLIHFLLPQFYAGWRVKLARQVLKNAVNKAARIIVISASTARDLQAMFPDEDIEPKIRIIYQGKSDYFHPLPEETAAQFKEQQKLGRYILYVGTRKRHKNLGRMVQAYARLLDDFPDLLMVAVGQGSDQEDELAFWRNKLGIKGIIEYPRITQTQLLPLYCGAEALVVPSLYEGFGLPPLEAMACGTPVVVSYTSSLPEVVGDAGIYFDPYNVDDMVNSIRQVISNRIFRKELSRKGLQQAEHFAWKKTARQTLEVYKEIMLERQ